MPDSRYWTFRIFTDVRPGKMPSMAFICSNHIIYRAATAANDAPNAVLSDDDPTNLNGYIGEVHFYDRVSHAFAIRELGGSGWVYPLYGADSDRYWKCGTNTNEYVSEGEPLTNGE